MVTDLQGDTNPTSNRCWARSVGNCAGGLSKEHIVSKALLESTPKVRGFRWCQDRHKTISKNTLVAKVLCVEHNNQLSPCDAEALRYRNALKTAIGRTNNQNSKDPKRKTIEINRNLIARWICKTVCNALAADGRHPPDDFVAFAFAHRVGSNFELRVRARVGLYVQLNADHLCFSDYSSLDHVDKMLFAVDFYGLEWLLANWRLGRSDVLYVGDREAIYTGDFIGVGRINLPAKLAIKFV